MFKSPFLDTILPTIHGIGGMGLLAVVPDQFSFSKLAELGIVIITSVVQILHLFKKRTLNDKANPTA